MAGWRCTCETSCVDAADEGEQVADSSDDGLNGERDIAGREVARQLCLLKSTIEAAAQQVQQKAQEASLCCTPMQHSNIIPEILQPCWQCRFSHAEGNW